MSGLPGPAARPCNDCPWRRKAAPGWLGPHSADEWVSLAHSDEPIACHVTLEENESWQGAKQCAGAAIYRGNVTKRPRNSEVAVLPPDRDQVFATPMEFKKHHTGGTRDA